MVAASFAIPILLGTLLGWVFLRDASALARYAVLAFTAGILLTAVIEETSPSGATIWAAPITRDGPTVVADPERRLDPRLHAARHAGLAVYPPFHTRDDALTKQPRVTVVNDNPEFLALVGEILTSDRFVAKLVDGDRGDALEHIRESDPDVLMVDLRLGTDGLHGWDIAQAVRRDPNLGQLPILVCSADHRAMEELGEQAATDTRVELLRKPFALDDLIQAIERLLDRGVPA